MNEVVLDSLADARRRMLPVVVLCVIAFAPLSMELFMPALPTIAGDLGASASVVNFTVTGMLLGLAIGQLFGGPLSDRYGRRRILILGLAVYVGMAIACAVMPSIETLIAARIGKGIAAGFATISATAAGRDLYEGKDLAKFFARVAVAAGITAAITPNIGKFQLLRFYGWRGVFVALALVSVATLIATIFIFTDTLAPINRTKGGLFATIENAKILRKDRSFVSAILFAVCLSAALFGYVSSSAFVFQGIYQLTPQTFGIVLGTNAFGMVGSGYLGGRLAAKFGPRMPITIGASAVSLGGAVLLFGGFGAPLLLPVVMAAMFIVACGAAITTAPVSTLAVSGYPKSAGTAVALVGVARFASGAIVAPIVAIGGAETTLMVGITITAVGLLALLTCFITASKSKQSTPALEPDLVLAA